MALGLGSRGRHLESLPYFRHALAGIRQDFWAIHRNYAAALNNAALEVRALRGTGASTSRASFERIAMLREAQRELELAERLAPDPRIRAALLDARGGNLELWGFPWDALQNYRAALAVDPASAAIRAHAEGCAARLKDPEGR